MHSAIGIAVLCAAERLVSRTESTLVTWPQGGRGLFHRRTKRESLTVALGTFAWDSKDQGTPRLTPFSHNAIAGPLHVAPDLHIVHRRFADGISDKPVHHLPTSWRQTIYEKLTRPARFRIPPHPSAIVLCSSQLEEDSNSKKPKQKSLGFFRTVRSLLSLNRVSVPNLDFILAVAPPKLQRVPNSSAVFRTADRTLDPGSFAYGYFCIVDFVRPDVWDPEKKPDVDDEQLEHLEESAWEVDNITKYNIDYTLTDDEDDADLSDSDNGSNATDDEFPRRTDRSDD